MHYLVFYDVVDDYIEKRAAFRQEHLNLARQAYERGELVLGGALAEPVDGTVIVFRGPTEEAAEAFVRADPYVANGLVKAWRIRKWNTVIGDGTSPV